MAGKESRYVRQIRFAPIGAEGQRRIQGSRVAIVGLGALGSVQAELLARAGAGTMRLVDRDFVELGNLQRQFLYDEADAEDAVPKAVAAARRVARINSSIEVDPIVADLAPSNADELLGSVDLILDATDNFETRYLINDFAVREGTPWIYGGAVGSYGLKLAIVPGRTACFRCVYPDPAQGAQPTCETEGVLGPATAAIASLQSGDALKMLAEGPDSVDPLLTTIDVWSGRIRQIAAPARDPDCPCCVRRELPYLDGRRRAPISLCGRNAVQIHERSRPLDLLELAGRLRPFASVRLNEFALRAVVDEYEITVFPDGRAIVRGTTDTGVARSIYARYIGA
ncbi:MAG: ThiF family adenylyltransferase [Bryobacterales bacterium]|nr:ThiF family adenylyltransferase [Bryobacterales bacterium]MBV9400886.1 ThiF family adenylyltransferase [Bryobacterales bacterium]